MFQHEQLNQLPGEHAHHSHHGPLDKDKARALPVLQVQEFSESSYLKSYCTTVPCLVRSTCLVENFT